MGQLIAAYRSHPEHGMPISQEIVGLWALKSQSQICKIENGRALDNLSHLQFWARLLQVPSRILWFFMPESPASASDQSDASPAGATLFAPRPASDRVHWGEGMESAPAVAPASWGSGDVGTALRRNGEAVAPRQRRELDLMTQVASTISGISSVTIGDDTYRHLVADLVRWAKSMNRREVLQWLAWAAGTAAASLELLDSLDPDELDRTSGALVEHGRVDATVVGHIDGILWRCMRQDDALGPQAALATVLAQRDLVQGLLTGASADHRDALLSLLANLSRFAGWLAFDLGDYDAASAHYEAARADAHEARNTELGALVLCNMSHLATWRGRPRVGIDHAMAAQGWAAQTDDRKLRAYTFDVAARAFARDQRDRAARDALDRAQAEISEARDESSWAYFFNAGQLESTRAVCLLSLGKAEEAAAVAQNALNGIDPSFVRNLGIASTYLGLARLGQRRPDVAAGAAALADAVQLSGHNRSVRLAQTLQGGLSRLAKWRDEPAARETLSLASSYHLV